MFVRGKEPRIRIRTKMSRIRNAAAQCLSMFWILFTCSEKRIRKVSDPFTICYESNFYFDVDTDPNPNLTLDNPYIIV